MIRAALAVLLAATVAPQEPQRPTFRTGAELVRVDVTVNDSQGRPVTDLTADDFTVEEDGVPQKIQSFKFVELTGQRAPGDDLSLTISSRQHAATEVARDDVRVFLIVWDEYHIPPLYPAERMRGEVINFIRTMTGPTDIIALMDLWTPMSDLQFTRDHDELIFATGKLQGRQGIVIPPRNQAEENQMRSGRSIPLARAQVAASALKSAMMHLGALRQGRSTVIYVGNDFRIGMDSFLTTSDLVNTANDANVAVYSISTVGLQVRAGSGGILRDLANNTGGEALRTNSPSVALRRIADQSRASYLLGYSPEPRRFDGKFRKIRVRVKKPGMEVRARNGYWAPDVAAVTRARSAAAEGTLPSPIAAAFGELVRLDRLETSAAGWSARTMMVPDPPTTALRVTMPQVWRIQRPAELAPVMGDAPPASHQGREFTRTDRLVIRFGADGTLAPGARATVALVDRRGKRLTDLPFRRDAAKPGAWVIDLPLTSISRGDYVIALELASGTERSAAYIPLRISQAF